MYFRRDFGSFILIYCKKSERYKQREKFKNNLYVFYFVLLFLYQIEIPCFMQKYVTYHLR